MNEEIEYAEMLEIPVSTVNVVRKKHAKKRKNETKNTRFPKTYSVEPASSDLKQSVIAQVNDKLQQDESSTENITADAQMFAESANSQGSLDFNDIPERIDTVRLYSENERPFDDEIRLEPHDYDLSEENSENDGDRYETNYQKKAQKRVRIALGAEFAVACALCGGIFLTNVFMPGSAINTFFRALHNNAATATDTRTYADFKLSSVVSDLSNAELTLSPTGILSFTDKCHVYPAANGTVSAVTQNEDGTYVVKIAHSDTFTGVVSGLSNVYYAVGDEVKANVPVGYSGGEKEVQVTMYSEGELLNCFKLTEENCLAWVTQE